MLKSLLTQQGLSELIGVAPRTLERWRVEGSGPRFCRAGRKILYPSEDVEKWLLANRRISTSDHGQ